MLILGVILYIRHIVNICEYLPNIWKHFYNNCRRLLYISLFIHFCEYLANIWKHLFVIQGVVFYISYQESLKNIILFLCSFYISSTVRYKIRHKIYNTCLFISKESECIYVCVIMCVYTPEKNNHSPESNFSSQCRFLFRFCFSIQKERS